MRSLAARVGSHFSAWKNLPALRALTLANCSVEEVAAGVFDYAGGFFWPDQVFEEIVVALKEVERLQPRYIVEIGTNAGGTLLLWSRVAHPEATIVSIDLRGGQAGIRTSPLREPLFRRMGLSRQKIHLVNGDSHNPATLELAKKYLLNNPVDFLFIDGDHSENGVRSDYEMYGPLVRPGGMIGFHDIAVNTPECRVIDLWRELTQSAKTWSIVGSPPRYGIGLLYR
jgi:predicted O-methyltransferase YrrM